MVLIMDKKETIQNELAGVYESLLYDLNERLRSKIVDLKEIVKLYESIEKLEERLDELTFNEDDG